MCIGDMSLPAVDAVIPTARRAQLPERSVRSTTSPAVTSPASVAAPGGSTGASRGSSSTSSTSPSGSVGPPADGRIPDPDDGGRLPGDGSGGDGSVGPGDDGIFLPPEDDDGQVTPVDDEGNPIGPIVPEEGPTTSPARIVSPLIRAVQGERQINRRGRNALFIKQGTGVRRVKDRFVNSSDRPPPQTFVSPFESGLIPLRR